MPFAATWMKLEIIILSEVSQTEKYKYHMISLICGIENMTQVKLSETDSQTQKKGGAGWIGSLELVDVNDNI